MGTLLLQICVGLTLSACVLWQVGDALQHGSDLDPHVDETPPDHRYNIKLYGAVGDGATNDTDAFLSAMKAASQAINYSSVYVPAGRYLIWPLLLDGCVNTWIEVEGAIVAPTEPLDWPQNEYYIQLLNPSNCSIVGLGSAAEIEGNGMGWWSQPDIGDGQAPALIVFTGEFDGYPQPGIYNISLFNAPSVHILVKGTRMYSGPEVTGVKISATDQGASSGVRAINASIFMENVDIDVGGINAMIETGYGEENRGFFRVYQSTFRRGGGFLIEMTDGLMGNISLSSMTFIETSYGIRALGTKDGSGNLIGVFVDDLYMMNVGTPILISNDYCPKSHKGCTRPAKGVLIEGFSVFGLSATQSSGDAGSFLCTTQKPCSVDMNDVDIRPMAPTGANEFHCENAHGYAGGAISPKSCLKPDSTPGSSRRLFPEWGV